MLACESSGTKIFDILWNARRLRTYPRPTKFQPVPRLHRGVPARPRAGRLKRYPGAFSTFEAGQRKPSAFRSLHSVWYCTATQEGLCIQPGPTAIYVQPGRRAIVGKCNTNK